ncbi:MAG: alanine--tRNA ligase [Acidimicrobiia bacterium]|nr:alanine--tRNA ligase [Acidimicrobiia bacterium]
MVSTGLQGRRHDVQVQEIREKFTQFFVDRDHELRPSASLIPTDPTLLLNNAGMVPFKPYFLGEEEAPWGRAVTCQKVFRTVDIDIIGTTTRHVTFFEMLGNFSFGDYFKEKAIPWSQELVTEVFGLDPDRLWYTVYDTDDEAAQIWIDDVGIPPERVQKGGRDNFWQMGVAGPCGPSSELFYDKGPEFGDPGGPVGGGEERFVEIWNLVFMQNIQDVPYHVVGDLPAKNIDTGMGLERVAAILQDVPTLFEIDSIRPMVDLASNYLGSPYGRDEQADVVSRILGDHSRAAAFLISDGVVPSNDGRGYILRRILRRGIRHAWLVQQEGLVFPQLCELAIDVMSPWYSQLSDDRDLILTTVEREEIRFRRTLESGHQLLDETLEEGVSSLPGEVAFKLHDTYGFPIELTTEIATERGVDIDQEGFELEMQQQRDRARAAWKGGDEAAAAEVYRKLADNIGLTDFVGYEEDRSQGRLLALIADGEHVDKAEEGRLVEVFVDQTAFYAESGGQVGDTGSIVTPTGLLEITDTQFAIQGLHSHRARVASGHVEVGQDIDATIDSVRREGIRKSHTGTHVLHWALREILGDHAQQAGSLVDDGRLRFDFSHFTGLSDEQLGEVEWQVNRRLISNDTVGTTVTTNDEAREMGAIAFFGDKYGEKVRVVKIGDYSLEFCGGTHTNTAGQVGPLIFTAESSIGSNIRRVDALTGEDAYRHLARVRQSLDRVGRRLKVPTAEIPERVESLIERVSDLEGRLSKVAASDRTRLAEELASDPKIHGEVKVVVATVPESAPGDLRQLVQQVQDRLGENSLVVLGAPNGSKGGITAAAGPGAIQVGASAGEIAAEGAAVMGGGGSRDPALAQAGGPDGSALSAAMDVVREAVGRALAGV